MREKEKDGDDLILSISLLTRLALNDVMVQLGHWNHEELILFMLSIWVPWNIKWAAEIKILVYHLNAAFQRIARRDKKDFLRDQCKEIEENNKMGKMRDFFKKIRDKAKFHARWAQ